MTQIIHCPSTGPLLLMEIENGSKTPMVQNDSFITLENDNTTFKNLGFSKQVKQ